MKHEPLQLRVEEPSPGAFLWTVIETDSDGKPVKVLRSAEDASESYEAALAAGTRALNARLQRGEGAP